MSWGGKRRAEKKERARALVWIDVWAWADVPAAGPSGARSQAGVQAVGGRGRSREGPAAPPPSLCRLAPGPPTTLQPSLGICGAVPEWGRCRGLGPASPCAPAWLCHPKPATWPLWSWCARSAKWGRWGRKALLAFWPQWCDLWVYTSEPGAEWGCTHTGHRAQHCSQSDSAQRPLGKVGLISHLGLVRTVREVQ